MKKLHNIEEKFFRVLMFTSTNLIVIILLLIIISILYKGLPALSWSMISQTPKGGFYFGKEGGILNAIIGSMYLAVGSTVLATAIGLPVALFMNVILVKHQRLGVRLYLGSPESSSESPV